MTAAELADGLPEGVEGLHFHVLFESDSYTLGEGACSGGGEVRAPAA
ncbi:MAG: hypothetical protein MZV63_11780 [Marinilabiliales bacterium]|nr:hypothetical protein [Marinilabiliales bacterium]